MNEVDMIFDAVAKASRWVHLKDEIAKKKEQIRDVNSLTCGNCNHWMKTSCIPEKKHGKFKSSASFACEIFQQCSSSIDLAEKFGKELKQLESDLSKL